MAKNKDIEQSNTNLAQVEDKQCSKIITPKIEQKVNDLEERYKNSFSNLIQEFKEGKTTSENWNKNMQKLKSEYKAEFYTITFVGIIEQFIVEVDSFISGFMGRMKSFTRDCYTEFNKINQEFVNSYNLGQNLSQDENNHDKMGDVTDHNV